mmetsp:Transcript_19292/g.27970  ORF Transcript_19292/g.27970 Transcript_19292/m.27970 type:complete len:208 (+) Transcript_19292:512-1135(+)
MLSRSSEHPRRCGRLCRRMQQNPKSQRPVRPLLASARETRRRSFDWKEMPHSRKGTGTQPFSFTRKRSIIWSPTTNRKTSGSIQIARQRTLLKRRKRRARLHTSLQLRMRKFACLSTPHGRRAGTDSVLPSLVRIVLTRQLRSSRKASQNAQEMLSSKRPLSRWNRPAKPQKILLGEYSLMMMRVPRRMRSPGLDLQWTSLCTILSV